MFGKKIRHINRYREIAAALISQGFYYIVEEMGLAEKVPYYRRSRPDSLKNPQAIGERIRLVLQQLGPTYIKLGQIASTRPDIFPAEVIAELEKLQDKVPPFSYPEVQSIIHQELGTDLEELYGEFNPEPIAAASIGQVHQAVLQTGEKVAVKIQRPGIAADINTDLEILYELASLAERRFTWIESYQPVDMVEEFSKSLQNELDYTFEARNAERIAKQFINSTAIYIPKVYWTHSTKKVLTAEYIDGIKINEKEKLEQQGYHLSRLADQFTKSIFQQIFIAGFFHGDPHPGNVVVLPGEVIAFLDFGMVGRLNEELKYNLASLVIALMRQNPDELVKSIFRMGIVPEQVNRLSLRDDIAILQEKYYGVPLSKVSLGEAVNNIFAITLKYKIKMPADFVLVGKTLLTLEGVIENLDPDVSILDIAEPFGQKLLKDRLHPKDVARRLWKNINSFGEALSSLPDSVKELSTVASRGRLRLDISIAELKPILDNQDRISNQLSFCIILLSFSIIMASIIVSLTIAGRSSLLWRIPVVEIGFAIAMVMLFGLLYAIIRAGKS